MLSSLAAPTQGQILVDGKDISEMDKYEFRSSIVGVVFQNFNLLTHLTAVENVILSMDISGKKISDKKARAKELLAKVIIVTHSQDVADAADVTYHLSKSA